MRRIETTRLCAICSGLMFALSAVALGQSSQTSQTPETASTLPNSPGTVQATTTTQDQNKQDQSKTSPQSSEPSIQLEEKKPERPVGTAVAEAPLVSGTPAAQPAGVAAAPGKQRRVRTIVLRVGAIVGAGVAVGAVVALTAGTPSKPPGAH